MTDRYRRSQNRRRIARRIWFFVAALLLWRVFGPAVFFIGTSSLSPVLDEGDVVFARPSRDTPHRGAIVLVPPPLGGPSLFDRVKGLIHRMTADPPVEKTMPNRVARLVIATEGDQVSWNDRVVAVSSGGGDESVLRYRFQPIDRDVKLPLRQTIVPDGHIFLVTLGAGHIDSRYTGPVPYPRKLFVAQRILLPIDRGRTFGDEPVDLQEYTYEL